MKDIKVEKKWNLLFSGDNTAEIDAVKELSRALGMSEIMAKLLYVRGYQTPDAAKTFLTQGEAQFHDPYLLKDVEKAVDRIERAVEDHEMIVIYGDYDVDGVTSVSLLYLYLMEQGAKAVYYIPRRSKEGYGMSTVVIDTLQEYDVGLIITVDTGITAIEEIDYANCLGIDTVVTDHHECRAELPDACAVVNPHRPDDSYPFKDLAGVGVIFKVICAYEMRKYQKQGISEIDAVRRICHEYGDLVAIGTIADVMPIVDENRLIVKMGLRLLESTKRHGLQALIEAANGNRQTDSKYPPKKRKINSSFIGFVIAPRINAAGRVKSADTAVELLLATDEERAKQLAEELCDLNHERQVEENRIAEAAYKKIDETFDPQKDHVIVISDDEWQQGIIGIVSSRITEKYGVPSILISFDGATEGLFPQNLVGKGSGRSVKGLNLVEALADSEELLVRFGGHELAAGLSIRRKNIDAFRERINEYAAQRLADSDHCFSIDADCLVEMRDLTLELAHEIDRMEPFGNANATPVLMLCGATLQRILPMGNGKHTKLILEKDGVSMTAVWFGTGADNLHLEPMDTIDILFQLNINEFQNITQLQMIVQDVRLTPSFEDDLAVQKKRYLEIKRGATFSAEEDAIPTRDDMAVVYTSLRREYQFNHTYFPIRRLLGMLKANGHNIGYIKLKMIIRIMQELQLCEITETGEDCYVFDFYYTPAKTSIEKSSLLKRLRTQLQRP